jgi:hypothetical protein
MSEKQMQQSNQPIQQPDLVNELKDKYFNELDKEHQRRLLRAVIQLGIVQPRKKKGIKYLEKTTQNITAEQLKDMIEEGEIRLPIFQRGKVWDKKKKGELIYSILTLGVIPEIIVYEGKGGIKYLIDGWQRASTIADFIAGKFKLEFDEKIEHIGEDADEKELLKSLFERVNYKSTPLSKHRIVLLTIFTLGGKTQKEKEEIEQKLKEIQNTALRIKQEDRTEKNIGFILRTLTAYKVYEMLERGEEIPYLKAISDLEIELLKPFIEKISLKELVNKLHTIYELATILEKGKPHKVLSKGMKKAEIFGLILYNFDKLGFGLKKGEKIDEYVDIAELQEVVNLLENEINKALEETGRKQATLTKDTKIYAQILKRLLEKAKEIGWNEFVKIEIPVSKEVAVTDPNVEQNKEQESQEKTQEIQEQKEEEQKQSKGNEPTQEGQNNNENIFNELQKDLQGI